MNILTGMKLVQVSQLKENSSICLTWAIFPKTLHLFFENYSIILVAMIVQLDKAIQCKAKGQEDAAIAVVATDYAQNVGVR